MIPKNPKPIGKETLKNCSRPAQKSCALFYLYNGFMAEDQFSHLARRKLAILIDGDNAQSSLLTQMLVEAAKYGMVTVRRIYGDWTTPNMNSWKDVLNFHAVQPIQQFRYTVGKNATDSAMIIDAMDILHSKVVDGFVLVSSDSDYTRLATRIRESGVYVMGIGEKKTPKPFVNACDLFVYTENLVGEANAPTKRRSKKPTKPSGDKKKVETETEVEREESQDPDPMPMLEKAFSMNVQEDGWARLSDLGTTLYQLDPGFDPRTYGQRQLSRLIVKLKDYFEMADRLPDGAIYIRLKDQ